MDDQKLDALADALLLLAKDADDYYSFLAKAKEVLEAQGWTVDGNKATMRWIEDGYEYEVGFEFARPDPDKQPVTLNEKRFNAMLRRNQVFEMRYKSLRTNLPRE